MQKHRGQRTGDLAIQSRTIVRGTALCGWVSRKWLNASLTRLSQMGQNSVGDSSMTLASRGGGRGIERMGTRGW